MKNVQRRDFLRVLGWGGASASVGACGFTSIDSGVETVKSYVEPEDFNIPGIAVYYASTCTQCEALCGVVGRVRDGRVLKLEGNPVSGINQGKLCGLGQASVQHHYNPDRLRAPLMRQDGGLKPVSWTDAMATLLDKSAATKDGRFAFLTGPVSGHLKVLVRNATESLGSNQHFTYDPLSTRVNRAAADQLFGAESPRLLLDQAHLIVSFGADFLDTWVSPVHFAGQYARFRRASDSKPRGVLVQIEPRMTLTGANADRWIAIRPGSEGVLALGLANALLTGKSAASVAVPPAIATAAAAFDKTRVAAETGVSEEVFDRLVRLLRERAPSVVLSGPSAEGHVHGSSNAQAILALNWVLGNVGKTVLLPPKLPFPQIAPESGDTASLQQFTAGLAAGKFDTVFLHDVNPVYSAPAFLKYKEIFPKAGFKVVFAQYLDETAREADLVLPVDSALEDWGTHLPAYQPEGLELTLQQPLMERLYPDGTRSVGDVLLELLKRRRPEEYKGFADYYAYLRAALLRNRSAFVDAPGDDEQFWTEALSKGVLRVNAQEQHVPAKAANVELDFAGATQAADAQYPFRLAPAVRASLRDGRNANLPWMQETPDTLTTIVWDSWAEVHPATAKRLGIVDGDILEVASASGSLKVQAYVFPGIHPDVIGVPLGQGHESMGRYADGRGANPFRILDPVFDRKTGELAMYATRVRVTKTGARGHVVKDEGWKSGNLKTQAGRKLVVTVAADKAKLSEEV
ncbi:Molybdopterin oxidoreductase [Burkholderiales bacterium]|jgi:molybdopterin-containing oxidoreductase family iron-sulfur binding subunit|nr:Molybdopterin oxidoreductase [Burkholderiales bacterium]